MIAKLIQANKIYETPAGEVVALNKTDLELNQGELLLVIGPSGSGKTTLLSLIGCLINPTEGEVEIEGKRIKNLNAKEMSKIRLNTIGFVFQQFNLLVPLSGYDNVAFPLMMQNYTKNGIKEKTLDALAKVDMIEHMNRLPKQLSNGQQQRIAIARALVTNPKIILCDEPTASLDKDSLGIVMEELKMLVNNGRSVAVVTHDPRLLVYADKAVEVKNGLVNPINDLTKSIH